MHSRAIPVCRHFGNDSLVKRMNLDQSSAALIQSAQFRHCERL